MITIPEMNQKDMVGKSQIHSNKNMHLQLLKNYLAKQS